jgi:hypothetical protein
VFFYTVTVENQEENTELFDMAREYGNTLLNKHDYDPLWVGVVSWHNLRPNNPGNFEPVSTTRDNGIYTLPRCNFVSNVPLLRN